MKLGYRLVISFLIVTVIMGAFGFYMFNNVHSNLSQKQQEINGVSELTSAIQDFHIENYHAQSKMWEYAYEPNEERLNSFYEHLITWEKLFAEFMTLADAAELTPEGSYLIADLKVGVELVRAAWLSIVNASKAVATGTIDEPTLNDDGTEKYPLLDDMAEYGYHFSYPMFDMSTCDPHHNLLYASMIYLEDLFDAADFNENADKFVALQQEKLTAKQAEMDDLKSSLTTQFIIAFVIVLIVAIAMALLLTRFIVGPIRKLTTVANAVSQGKTDLTVPNIKSKDEIGDLAKSFGRMVASIKFMMTDKEE
jgi:Signal transduction histidine kinase involved in nitrogen fixation and metabolism regulation